METTIRNLISFYKRGGFRIKIPGGNERNDTFAAFCALVRYNFFHASWQIVLIPWRPRTEEEERNKREKKYPETPEQTVAREVGEETGCLLIDYKELAKREIKDKRPGHEEEYHLQHLYFSRYFDSSNWRRKPSPSQPNIEVPFWADLSDELEREIAIEHLWMIQEVRRYLSCIPIPRKKKIFYDSKKKPEPRAA